MFLIGTLILKWRAYSDSLIRHPFILSLYVIGKSNFKELIFWRRRHYPSCVCIGSAKSLGKGVNLSSWNSDWL